MESRSMIGVAEKCNRGIDSTDRHLQLSLTTLRQARWNQPDGESNWWIDQRLDLWGCRRGDNAPNAISR
jgi:hypothetical protein